MSKPFIREVYALYIYNGKYYFYSWNHWSEFGTLTCSYADGLKSAINGVKIKKNKLYRAGAIVVSYPDNPDSYDSAISLVEVDDPRVAIGVTIRELEQLEEMDKDIVVDNLKLLLSKF